MKGKIIFIIFLSSYGAYSLNNDNKRQQQKSLIAYDCSSKEGSLRGISLLNDDDCSLVEHSSTKTYAHGQLLYRKKFEFLPFIACYIHIQIQVEKCGGFIYHPAQKPNKQRFMRLSREHCERVINERKFQDNHYPQIKSRTKWFCVC